MVTIDEAFKVEYRKDNHCFEVLVDFDKLEEFKKNPNTINVYDVLADNKIFKDHKKGELASENLLNEIFNKDEEDILKEILLNGKCQIPTSYINKLRENVKKNVVNYISENTINAQNNSKFPPTMIEREISKLNYNFNPYNSAQNQVDDILQLLKKNMPIKIDEVTINLCIPCSYIGVFYGSFRKLGKIKKEVYDDYGNLNLKIKTTRSNCDKIIDFAKQKTSNKAEYYIEKEE